MKERMPPKKKLQSPGRKVKGNKYPEEMEMYEKKRGSKKKISDMLSMDMMLAKEGYSKKPRVKAQKKKQMGY